MSINNRIPGGQAAQVVMPAMIPCHDCGTDVTEDHGECPACGAEL